MRTYDFELILFRPWETIEVEFIELTDRSVDARWESYSASACQDYPTKQNIHFKTVSSLSKYNVLAGNRYNPQMLIHSAKAVGYPPVQWGLCS